MNRTRKTKRVTQPTQPTKLTRGTKLTQPPSPPASISKFSRAEGKLITRIYEGCGAAIARACLRSSVPPEFLGALVANESGGNAKAARFEPSVYRHLKDVADGVVGHYGGISAQDLAAEVAETLHPKSADYHARFLTVHFAAHHGSALAATEDEALRELATSWGYTQIMGYHMVGRAGTKRDLLNPDFHFQIALELLAGFAEEYQLDLRCEFAEMFRCWNTGRPYAATFDPNYVENGLRRMQLYREYAAQHAPNVLPVGADTLVTAEATR